MRNSWRLAAVSFLILFLELLLIRLVGTEIRIFAYLGNLILLAIFVGSGIGMYIKKPVPLSASAVLLFLTSAMLTTSYILRTPRFDVKLFSGISELLSPLSEAYIWQTLTTFSKTGAILGLVLTAAILVLLAAVFVPLGNLLGRLLAKYPQPLQAYSINVAASLAGMWGFQLFSLLMLPPLLGVTAAIAGLLLLAEEHSQRSLVVAALMATIAIAAPKIALQPYEGPVTFWSPYQKLTLSILKPAKTHHPGGYYLEVNNVGYMGLLNLSPEHVATASAILVEQGKAAPADTVYRNQYSFPYLVKPQPEDVLIIGAGAGNDASAAIKAQAQRVDAVEIDPAIVRIGKNYHHEQPYQSPRVQPVVADGRAFMERTRKLYDLIVMGLADSHTLSSSLTNLRLDHYLYTRESLARARELLKPDGVLALSFEVTRPWIGQRLTRSVTEAFGHQPLVFEIRSDGAFGWGGYMFLITKDPAILDRILEQQPELAAFIAANKKDFSATTRPLTDDWPYLYLDQPRLPLIHLLTAAFFLGALAFVKRTVLPTTKLHLPMFLWGIGFLLFEFQNISKASLLFGLTWQTNMIIISSILALILAANWTVNRKLLPANVAFLGLMASLIAQLVIPLHLFNRLPFLPKLLLGGVVLNLPFFFGAIIFASWFAKSKDRSAAFASNLLGAAAGGLLEMFSFLTGIKSLLVLTIVFYALGWYLATRKPPILARLKFGK